jgi:UDP-glucose 4-epimerase
MAGEGLIAAYCEGYGFEGHVFRFVSLLGPRYPHGHVFDFVRQLIADPSRLTILGDGSQRKSYLHVADCVAALMHLCERGEKADAARSYEVYHLGVPDACLVRESARWICDEMKVTPRLEFGTGNRGWIGDSPFVLLDVSKAMSRGWRPAHSIESSIRATVRWLLENRWIFDRRR